MQQCWRLISWRVFELFRIDSFAMRCLVIREFWEKRQGQELLFALCGSLVTNSCNTPKCLVLFVGCVVGAFHERNNRIWREGDMEREWREPLVSRPNGQRFCTPSTRLLLDDTVSLFDVWARIAFLRRFFSPLQFLRFFFSSSFFCAEWIEKTLLSVEYFFLLPNGSLYQTQ